MRDPGSKRLASEELLASARRQFDPATVDASVAARQTSSPESESGEPPPQQDGGRDLAGWSSLAPSDPFASEYGAGAFTDGTPPQVEPGPAPAPPGVPESLGRRIWSRRAYLIGGVVVASLVYTLVFDHSKAVTALTPGDCFQDPGTETVYEIEGIDCDQPHDYEVFASVDVGAKSDPFPGDDTLFLTAFNECLRRFEGYVGAPFDGSLYWIDSLIPTSGGWGDGDRQATCLLYQVDGSGEAVLRTSGTARSSAR